MESERKKYYKNRVKSLSTPKLDENNVEEFKENSMPSNSNMSIRNSLNSESNNVTVLGSRSYHRQNQNLLIVNNLNENQKVSMEDNFSRRQCEDVLYQQTVVDMKQNKENVEIMEDNRNQNAACREIIHDIEINIEIEENQDDKDFEKMQPIEMITTKGNNDYYYIEENHNETEKIQEKRDEEKLQKQIQQEEISVEENNLEDQLQATLTEEIPEQEMEVLRKSLQDDEDSGNKDLASDTIVTKNTHKRASCVIKKCHIDFLSEDEDFVWDSTSWKDTGDDSSSDDENKRKKRRKHQKKITAVDGKVGDVGLKKQRGNKRNIRRDSRNKGKKYIKKSGEEVNEKQVKPNPCVDNKCRNKCGEITEEKRKDLFSYFWNLTNQTKREWLVTMSTKQVIKRKRSKSSSYRSNTYNYFINEGEGRRQVCLKFLLNTLDISHRFVNYTLNNATFGMSKADARGHAIPTNKTTSVVKESAINFIKDLPALPSHYSRKDSTKLYLPTEYKNIKNIYRVYKEERIGKGVDVVSEKIFRDIFNTDFNIGFHIPKKDKCVKCLRYEGKNVTEFPELVAHLEEKDASKHRLECHRQMGKENPSILCTSFDLQKVLNTPHGNSILLFYTRKYAVYNLCFYESITRNGYCYVWGETEGKRGGIEVSTILQKYIHEVDSRNSIRSLIMYSDCCPGQNRNRIVLAAVHNALLQSKNLETIQMNYLLPGHTEMTVDSMHSTIESSIRNTTVWAPSQWQTICQLARKEPAPYSVESLHHSDFKSFDEFSDKYFKGNLVGKINKIRIATFKKSSPNIMKIKFSMKDDAVEEIVQIFGRPKVLNSKYKSSLPITKAKYSDLIKLCDTHVIPRIFHEEYHKFQTFNGRDELLDTDLEDEEEIK